MTAMENLRQYLNDNYHDPQLTDDVVMIVEEDGDLFLDHVCEAVRETQEESDED